MRRQVLLSLIIERLKQVVGTYVMVLLPMWGMFLLNKMVLFGFWNVFGIVPRTLDIGSMIELLRHGPCMLVWGT